MTDTIPLTARDPKPFTPPALEERHEEKLEQHKSGPKPKKPIFLIAVPTLSERESIADLMFEMGVMPVTRDTIRNATLKVLVDEGDEGEDEATFLEGHWQQTEIYDEMLEIYREQELQRVRDEFLDPSTKREPFPMPEELTTMRDRIRARDIVDRLLETHTRLRKLINRQTHYAERYEEMMMRVFLRGWSNLETKRETIVAGQIGPAEPLTLDCLIALREEIGMEAFNQVKRRVMSGHTLTREEVGNSDSPPANASTKGGSMQGKGETASGDSLGTKTETKSSSQPTPDTESEPTTEQSSTSGGEEEAPAKSKDDTPTADPT